MFTTCKAITVEWCVKLPCKLKVEITVERKAVEKVRWGSKSTISARIGNPDKIGAFRAGLLNYKFNWARF